MFKIKLVLFCFVMEDKDSIYIFFIIFITLVQSFRFFTFKFQIEIFKYILNLELMFHVYNLSDNTVVQTLIAKALALYLHIL